MLLPMQCNVCLDPSLAASALIKVEACTGRQLLTRLTHLLNTPCDVVAAGFQHPCLRGGPARWLPAPTQGHQRCLPAGRAYQPDGCFGSGEDHAHGRAGGGCCQRTVHTAMLAFIGPLVPGCLTVVAPRTRGPLSTAGVGLQGCLVTLLLMLLLIIQGRKITNTGY